MFALKYFDSYNKTYDAVFYVDRVSVYTKLVIFPVSDS